MEYTTEYLEGLIADKIEENGQLEYKAAAALAREEKKVDELTKDISAFANAAGGVLIYGIAEFQEKERRHLPERLDPVNQADFSREWLDQKIALIRPRIEGLKIFPVHVGPAVSDYCYVVEIPQGSRAHQARDYRYYKRRNFETTPMEDYEVQDVMNRRKHPAVEMVTCTLNISEVGEGSFLFYRIGNTSSVMAKHFRVVFDLPLTIGGIDVYLDSDGGATFYSAQDDEGAFWRVVSDSRGQPLFPKDTLSSKIRLATGQLAKSPAKLLKVVRYQIYADEMPVVEGRIEPSSCIRRFMPSARDLR